MKLLGRILFSSTHTQQSRDLVFVEIQSKRVKPSDIIYSYNFEINFPKNIPSLLRAAVSQNEIGQNQNPKPRSGFKSEVCNPNRSLKLASYKESELEERLSEIQLRMRWQDLKGALG